VIETKPCTCEECTAIRIAAIEKRLLIDAAFRESIPEAVISWLYTDILTKPGNGPEN